MNLHKFDARDDATKNKVLDPSLDIMSFWSKEAFHLELIQLFPF